MKTILTLFLGVFLLWGCKTTETIRYVPVEVPVTVWRSDTLRITQTDSVYIEKRNDTVYLSKYKTIWRERIVNNRDTLTKVLEVPTPYPVDRIIEKRVRGVFWWIGLVVSIGIAIFALLRLTPLKRFF